MNYKNGRLPKVGDKVIGIVNGHPITGSVTDIRSGQIQVDGHHRIKLEGRSEHVEGVTLTGFLAMIKVTSDGDIVFSVGSSAHQAGDFFHLDDVIPKGST